MANSKEDSRRRQPKGDKRERTRAKLLEAARWLILRAAWTVDQGEDPRHSSSMAKLYGAGMVNRVVDRVMQIHGGMGYTRELPIERWYRQVRLMRIYEGTDEMQRLIISRDLLRGYTKIGGHLA